MLKASATKPDTSPAAVDVLCPAVQVGDGARRCRIGRPRECSIPLRATSTEDGAVARGAEKSRKKSTRTTADCRSVDWALAQAFASVARSWLIHRPLLRKLRIELDLAKRALILGNVLLQDHEQRLRLLRTEIDSL